MPIHSFAPLVDARTRILILGSMPSVKSLAASRYYVHPQNAFWKVLYGLQGDQTPQDFDARYQYVLEQGFGLWDVAASCEREGSADDAMREVVPNDIPTLLVQYPGIQVIGINGGKAWTLFQKHCWKALPRDIPVVRLPSTSPAYTLKPEAKLALWHEALAPWLKKEKP